MLGNSLPMNTAEQNRTEQQRGINVNVNVNVTSQQQSDEMQMQMSYEYSIHPTSRHS